MTDRTGRGLCGAVTFTLLGSGWCGPVTSTRPSNASSDSPNRPNQFSLLQRMAKAEPTAMNR